MSSLKSRSPHNRSSHIMTKKLTGAKLPMEELDIDSFLNSTSDSDDDSPSNSVLHRSLDEILNSSSSSDASPSPPSSPSRASLNSHRDNRLVDLSSSQNDAVLPRSRSLDPGPQPSRLDSVDRVKSGGFSGDPVWRPPTSTSSRQLPSLFGGVRANAKPGAALAAAAAASRSVTTPHAAAIKSRRAAAVQRLGEELNAVSSTSNGDSAVAAATEGRKSGDVSLDDDFNSSAASVQSAAVEDTDLGTEVEQALRDDLAPATVVSAATSNCKSEFDFGSNLGSEDREEEKSTSSVLLDVDDSVELHEPVVLESDREGIAREDLGTRPLEDEGNELETSYASSVPEVGDEDTSSIDDISDLVEERIGQLESERMNKQIGKKLRSSMKPLELAEEQEKKQAFTGLHWVEGAAAQPMRLEGVRRGSTTLGYFDIGSNNLITRTIASHAFRRDHGSPEVLAVHANYIAVGMTKGVIVVFPGRYSPHNVDNYDASKMQMLGLQGDRFYAAVTSMCFNQLGDLLLAGYGDGHITVWDIQKASAAKVITGEHNSPVVHALFLGQDSHNSRQFKAVTGDSKGLVLLHSFAVVPLINRFNLKTQCLLDGQRTGTVLSASPLILDESVGGALSSSLGNASVSSNSIGSMVGGVVGGEAGWKLFNEGASLVEEGVVVFATYQTALVVRLTPSLKIYAQLSKPDGVREGSVPYTAWKSASHLQSSSTENMLVDTTERVLLLAVAWDRKVQVAKLVKSELKICGKLSLDSAAIGVAWLDSHMLVVLTVMGQLYMFAKDGTVIHQTSFAVDGLGGDDLVTYHTHFLNVFGNPEKAYHNAIAVRGASIYILGPMDIIVSRLLPWKERIQVLRRAGDWMGALNMAVTLYDGEAHGVVDLPRSVDAVQALIMPYLVELLLSYVDEVFSYISVAFCNQMGRVEQDNDSKSGNNFAHSEIKEQFTRVGGVAVEFCVHIDRTDILFEDIFSKFVGVHHKDTFLELLEPYILRDMLGSLPPEIMQALVEHYSSKGWLQRVEQCVLHMDISSLDFNQVVRLCREHGLYGALIYLFNKGLDDFRAPLEELLVVSRTERRESSVALGYRMLVYLKYCFSGLAFPPGHGVLPTARLPTLRTELVQFLLENLDSQNSQEVPRWEGTYLNLYHFLELDSEATLDVLRCALVADETPKPECPVHDYVSPNVEITLDTRMMCDTQNELVQSTIDALVQIVERVRFPVEECNVCDADESSMAWPLKKDLGHLFEFISFFVATRKAHVSKMVLTQILEFLTSEIDLLPNNSAADNAKSSKRREKQVLALLETVPESDWDASYVLQLCEKACFHQVCGSIHKSRHQYLAALDSFMNDVDEPIHTFSFIDNILGQPIDNDAFRSAVFKQLPDLVILSRECTFFLVIDHFSDESARILAELHSQPRSLFLYLKTVIEVYLSGTLDFSYLIKDDRDDSSGGTLKEQSEGVDAYLGKISDFPKFVRNCPVSVTDDMTELYLELLCQYERNSVLKFLETFDSYRVEHCLRLCQEYGITDAAAFLLERVGDVGSALSLTLTALNDKFEALDRAVGNLVSKKTRGRSAGVEFYNDALKMKEVQDIQGILHSCIILCQRNTPRLVPEESEMLWFRLLDSFCGPLVDSFADNKLLKPETDVGILSETFNSHQADEEYIIKWKISKSNKGAHILRKLFSLFIKEIVEGMIGYVRLPTILSKLLSDNGSQEFGDFKITILGMLGTYGFERRILDTAKSLIESDTFYTMSLLKKGLSHGYAPRSLSCCLCNCQLTRNSPGYRIRIFNCGHATHLGCEVGSESSGRESLSGCPICAPKKNSQKPRNKSPLTENGLAHKLSSKPKRVEGTSPPRLREDSLENYGANQISRYDILINLEKDRKLVQVESIPPLRLAPPAVYHERIKKGTNLLMGESSNNSLPKIEKPTKFGQPGEQLKVKGSSLRLPLRSSIFGKQKPSKR